MTPDLVAALALELTHEPVSGAQRVAGSPTTAAHVLGDFGDREVGVWEMSAGAMSDTEADELFIVIAGQARVEFVDESRTVDLGPGSVMQLREGQRTVWTVTETLRKVYLA